MFFDETLYKKLMDEAPKMKLITIATMMDKFRMSG